MLHAGEIGRPRNVDALRELFGIAIFLEPALAYVILSRTELAVREVDPDGHLLQPGCLVGGDHQFDVEKPIGQDAQSALSELPIGAVEQTVIDVDGPAFHVALGMRFREKRVAPEP